MSPRGRLARALAGVGFALFLLALVEGLLRLALGPPPAPPLFRANPQQSGEPFQEEGGQVRAAFQRRDQVAPFAAAPAPGVPRVMVFGESSVRGGSNLSPRQEFPARLQERLAADGRPVEVLNLGRAGFDSGKIRRVVDAALAWEPDVVVLYMGHNDVGNAYMMRMYGDVGSALEARARILLGRLRLYGLLAAALAPEAPARDKLVSSGGASMGGLPLTPQARALIEGSFRQNLDYIVRAVQRAGARVVLATVASNLESWWTRVPACPDALPPGSWKEEGGGPRLVRAGLAPDELQAGLAAAPGCPELLYLQGLSLLSSDRPAALRALTRARDLDPVPLRATTEVVQAIRDVAAARGAPLVDVEAAVNQDPRMREYFSDNLHLSAAGHQLIADLLAPAVEPLLPAP